MLIDAYYFIYADLDAIVYTTPSEFAVRSGSNSSAGSPVASQISGSSRSSPLSVYGLNTLFVVFCSVWWLGRGLSR